MSSQSEKNAVILAMSTVEAPVILELGAHLGEEYQWLSQLKPSKYVMVEPDPENYAKLSRIRDPIVSLTRGAISYWNKQDGDFYPAWNRESLNHASGSIRKPTGHLKHFPEVDFGHISIPFYTLEAIAALEELYHIDLLWCDIQGAERDMIEGGRATLRKTRYMMIEAEPEVELYEGQALKPELIAMLPEWEIIKDFGYNLFMRNTKFA